MKTSDAWAKTMAEWEGFLPRAYDDFRPKHILIPGDSIRGTLTIGYGHTGPDVHIGDTITKEAAFALFEKDLAGAEGDVSRLVKVPLNQNQFDALVSFAFNCGGSNLAKSTLLKYVNKGDFTSAANEFPKWSHSNGVFLKALQDRREEEAKQFCRVVP